MAKGIRVLGYLLTGLAGLLVIIWLLVWLIFGGGKQYPDLSTAPILPESALEIVASFNEPFGNVAVSANSRIFFTVHPESQPTANKLMEWKDEKAVPFPNPQFQIDSLIAPLGLCVDQQNRLWVLDHGFHGYYGARVMAFNLENDELVYFHEFPKALGPLGSYFNDIQVSNDGRFLFISDVSAILNDPAIVIHDTQDFKSKRRLSGIHSVSAENFSIHTQEGQLSFFGRAVSLKLGVDGIVLSETGHHLYFAAMNNSGLYRIPIRNLDNFYLDDAEVNSAVEFVSQKVLSDGLTIDQNGSIYFCDIEHAGIARWHAESGLETLIEVPNSIRWADGMSYGPDSCIYFTDSALPQIMFKSKTEIAKAGPFYLYKIKMKTPGFPGR